MPYKILTHENIKQEHICCAFSDKKCAQSYEAKKKWLSSQFDKGFVFEKLDERAKVFIETVPSSEAWAPIEAKDCLYIGCFWVSGKYKGQGHGKSLLLNAIKRAQKDSLKALVTVVYKKKVPFLSDTKWLLKQGFKVVDESPDGFLLLAFPLVDEDLKISFKNCVKQKLPKDDKVTVYYSNRCPFSQYHVLNSLKESCMIRGLDLEIIKLETKEQAQNCPSPATIFSMFYKGEFVTTDISACMTNKFDKFI